MKNTVKATFIILILLFPLISRAGQSQVRDGNWLLNSCAHIIEIFNNVQIPANELVPASICTGFIFGVYDEVVVYEYSQVSLGYLNKESVRCWAKKMRSVTNERLARVVFGYLEANPTKLNLPATLLVEQAIFTAYPVPKSC